MRLEIRNITDGKLDDFFSILREASLWLQIEGKAMWDPHQLTPEHILKSCSTEQCYIGYQNYEAAAAMILQEEDPIFWPDSKNDSLFIHKLAVRRKNAGKGFSHEMIEWAKTRTKELDKTYLRLDCAADRPKLCSFYEKQGFRKVDERMMFGVYPTAFYEICSP